MTWNLEEFRNLCNNHGIPDTKIYQDALYLKSWRANNFGSKALDVWGHLFSTSQEIVAGDKEWNETQFNSESYIEAALQASHSLADIIAQIINVAILGSHFTDKADVDIKKVYRELNCRGVVTDITRAVQVLLDSPEYRYINGFVNTIKHRNLIYTDFHIEFGVRARNEQGMRFKSFTYNGVEFPITWASDIVNVTIPNLGNYIIDIGNAVNDYLR